MFSFFGIGQYNIGKAKRCGNLRQFNFRGGTYERHFGFGQACSFRSGIGGSGMSPVAEILYALGYTITGSGVNESDNVSRLRGLGIPIFMGA